MIKTGVVIDNFDPKYEGRCKIRIKGMHDEVVNGMYMIPDDLCPWVMPSPQLLNSNSFEIPAVHSEVRVNVEGYSMYYLGPAHLNNDIKLKQLNNTECNEKIKYISLYSTPISDLDGTKTQKSLEISYNPNEGLTIDANGYQIHLFDKPGDDGGLLIKKNNNCFIRFDNKTDKIKIKADECVFDCGKLKLREGSNEKMIDIRKLVQSYNFHTHNIGTCNTAPIDKELQLDIDTDHGDNINNIYY